MVVDDSTICRGMFIRWIESIRNVKVVASAINGVAALRMAKKHDLDLIILDIEMPDMDGLTALPHLLEICPNALVFIASSLTERNAAISMEALRRGATDYILKPDARLGSSVEFREEFVKKTSELIEQTTKKRKTVSFKDRDQTPKPTAHEPHNFELRTNFEDERRKPRDKPLEEQKAYPLRKASTALPAILAIGSSTGGPQALFKLFRRLRRPFPVPILLTQHMPQTFTAILANHIHTQTGIKAHEAIEGEALQPGITYVAPGGMHMIVEGTIDKPFIALVDSPQENFCKPAVDPLYRSIASIYNERALCIVLTGMGQDGMLGAKEVAKNGGTILAQDEVSSVVWGMPGAIANAGLASALLEPEALGDKINELTASIV